MCRFQRLLDDDQRQAGGASSLNAKEKGSATWPRTRMYPND